jgi:hypothetical protein
MSILDGLNDWSEVLLGVGILDLWKQASQSKIAAQKAEQLTHDKHLKEAVCVVQTILDSWSSRPGFWERLIRQLLLGNLLKKLKLQLKEWHSQISAADKFVFEAKTLLQKDNRDPLETQALSQAIALYQRYTKIIYDEKVLWEINQCQRELQHRQQFQNLVTKAEAEAKQKFIKRAIAFYHQAKQLYPTQAVIRAIKTCFTQLEREATYEADLQLAQRGFRAGKLRGALTLLESALTNFPRSDGTDLLEQLRRTIQGREKFRQGLKAEQSGAFKGATFMYEEAKALLDDPTECQIRLGLVAIKTKDWAKCQAHLKNVPGEQAAYLRGFACTKEENFQQAHREWQPLPQTTVAYQRNVLKSLTQRQRLLELQNIEQLVKDEKLKDAQAISKAFIQKFGSDSLVEGNLDGHIQPRLETAVWQNSNWRTIVKTVKQTWIEQPNLTSLHNWIVATYYYALVKSPEIRDFGSLENLIIALSTALANLRGDPSLQNVPWLGNIPVDYDSISSALIRRMEEAIDNHKVKNINDYLKLRDRYRLEMVSIRLIASSPTKSLKFQGIYITPGCYQLHKQALKDTKFPAQLGGTLYTSWGLAVAACVEGDTQRAIQLIPSIKLSGEAELFAQKFVAYHEGCYHLQQQKWRQAMLAFKQAQAEIRASTDWQKEVDKLCGAQRQAFSDFTEHLEFAQFWYDLLGSQLSRSYLAEYKAEQVREQLASEKITNQKALQELQALKQIDAQNPVLLDLIERVEFSQQIEAIDNLLKAGKFEEAVKLAKQSRHEQLRYIVAEFLLKILINIAKSGDLSQKPLLDQLGCWAYEICPNEPDFQEFYRQLKLRY